MVLILTLGCWLLALFPLSQVVGRDAHGDAVVGHAIAFFMALGFVGLTWLLLGGWLLAAATDQATPSGAGIAATLMYLAGLAGVGAAMYLIQDPRQVWPAVVPVLVPPTIAAYVLASRQPSLRALLAGPGAFGVGIAVVLISLAPWPVLFDALARKSEARAESAKRQAEWQVQEDARVRAENLVKLAAMSPDRPVVDWYDLLEERSGVRSEALARLRQVERRQADIEDMLAWGIPRAMMLLPDLDLKPTPQLCAAAQSFFQKRAKDAQRGPNDEPAPYTSEGYVEESIPGIQWLLSRGCDCKAGISALQAMVRTYADSPQRQKILSALADLRPTT
jgi:hypothetical protein